MKTLNSTPKGVLFFLYLHYTLRIIKKKEKIFSKRFSKSFSNG